MTIIIDRNYILYVLPSPDLSIFHITHHRNISWSIFHTDSITLGLTDKESTGDLPSKDKHPSSLPGIYFFNYRKKLSPLIPTFFALTQQVLTCHINQHLLPIIIIVNISLYSAPSYMIISRARPNKASQTYYRLGAVSQCMPQNHSYPTRYISNQRSTASPSSIHRA